MGTIISAATVMALYLNASTNAGSPYYYNADIDNGQVMTVYVYDDRGGSLSGRAEYRYAYDDEGRVSVKDIYAVCPETGRMKPVRRYEYAYEANGYSVEHRPWNSLTGSFGPTDGRMEYETLGERVAGVTTYRLSADGSGMVMVDRVAVMTAQDASLLAEGF